MKRKPKAKAKPKRRKFSKPVSWIVVLKDGKWNAAVDNHVDTKEKLIAQGWEIMGYPSQKDKNDAIDWIKSCHANAPRRRVKRK